MMRKYEETITRKRSFIFLLPAAFSGILLTAAFPPLEQNYLAWFAMLPLIWLLFKINPLQALLAGFAFAIPLNLYLNLYLGNVLYPYLSTGLATAAMIGLVLYTSSFYALFTLLANLSIRFKKYWHTALSIPSLWLLVEYLRSVGFMAYNTGYLGYSQWAYPFLLNICASYGYWGLPFLIIFSQTIVVMALLKALSGKELVIVGALFLFIFGAGLVLPIFETLQGGNEKIEAGLIQGNSKPEDIISGGKNRIMNNYLNLTTRAVRENPCIHLVVWPETVVDLDFRQERSHHPVMVEKAEELGISLLYGARIAEEDKLYNSITLLIPSQKNLEVYHKKRLVPFVEYFPLEELLNKLLDLDLLLGSYTADDKAVIFEFDGYNIAGVICFESYFGDHTRLFAGKEIDHLFILTNDAWFGESIGLDQHAQAAAIRAAEIGVGVTQVANSGITISFDYQGRELFRSGKNEEAIIHASIDTLKRRTIYGRYGDFFPAFWTLFLAFLTTSQFMNRTSAKTLSRQQRASRRQRSR